MLCDQLNYELSLVDQIRRAEEAVLVHDYKRVVFASDSLAEMLGYELSELEGMMLLDLLSLKAFIRLIRTMSINRLASILGRAEDFRANPTDVKHKTGNKLRVQACCGADLPTKMLNGKKARLLVLEKVPSQEDN